VSREQDYAKRGAKSRARMYRTIHLTQLICQFGNYLIRMFLVPRAARRLPFASPISTTAGLPEHSQRLPERMVPHANLLNFHPIRATNSLAKTRTRLFQELKRSQYTTRKKLERPCKTSHLSAVSLDSEKQTETSKENSRPRHCTR